MKRLQEHLHSITDPAGGHYLAGGFATSQGIIVRGARDPAPESPMITPDDLIRVASLSKVVTGRAALTLEGQGELDLDRPLDECLGLPVGALPPPVRTCLSHTSGISDRCGYIIDPPDTVPEFAARHAPEFHRAPEVGRFRYSNLNYVLLGAVLERATGLRFDHLVSDTVLGPLGVEGGFNWVGCSPDQRLRHIPLYQMRAGRLAPTVDGPETQWSSELVWRDGTGFALSDLRCGEDTGLFSPHAGLRTSLQGLYRLAVALGDDSDISRRQRQLVWRSNRKGNNGDTAGGLFPAFGLGLTLATPQDRIPGPLVGHAGHALGFAGGVWSDPDRGDAFAYILNGAADQTAPDGREAFFTPEEHAFFTLFRRSA